MRNATAAILLSGLFCSASMLNGIIGAALVPEDATNAGLLVTGPGHTQFVYNKDGRICHQGMLGITVCDRS